MKIIYFSLNYTTHDRRFLLKLAESSHEIWFLRLQNDCSIYEKRPLPPEIMQITLQDDYIKELTPESLLRLMPDLESILSKINPDLIHAGPVQSCGFMTAITGFHPFLIMSWGSDILVDAEKNKMNNWMTRYALSHSDMLVCDCSAVRNKVHQLVSYEDEHIVQFPWGVELSEFQGQKDRFDWRAYLGWKNNIVIISTRSWEKLYGIDTILNAFHRAYMCDSRLRLILIGNGSQEKEIMKYIKMNVLDDVIFLPGRINNDHMIDYLIAADMYVSASHSDGSSVSLLEAMAIGLPVIVSDIPSNREWVMSDRNGWLVSSDDSKCISRAILKAANLSLEERKQIYRNNSQMVEERANWDKNSQLLSDTYNKLYKKMKLNY